VAHHGEHGQPMVSSRRRKDAQLMATRTGGALGFITMAYRHDSARARRRCPVHGMQVQLQRWIGKARHDGGAQDVIWRRRTCTFPKDKHRVWRSASMTYRSRLGLGTPSSGMAFRCRPTVPSDPPTYRFCLPCSSGVARHPACMVYRFSSTWTGT
jgi:hypothetical protein